MVRQRLQSRKFLTALFEAEPSHAALSAALRECWHGQHSEASLALAAYESFLVLPKGEKLSRQLPNIRMMRDE